MKYIFLSLFFSLSLWSYAQMPMDTVIQDKNQRRMRIEERGEQRDSKRMKDIDESRNQMFGVNDPNLKLTAEQEKKINEHQMVLQKEINRLMAELKIKRSELNLLEMTDDPDNKKVDKTIDEIGGLMTKMMKQQSGFKLKVRSMLTAEQRIVFDKKQERRSHRREGM